MEIQKNILDQIVEQANKIANDCEYSAASNFALGKYWDDWNLRLGLASAVLAALAAYLAVGDTSSVLSGDAAKISTGIVAFAQLSLLLFLPF